MKSIRHNTIFLTVSNSIQVALSLILSISLARFFEEKEVFGKYQQLFIIINFLIPVTSGIPVGLSYFYGKYLSFSLRIKIYKRFWWSLILVALSFGVLIILCNRFLANTFGNDFFIDSYYYFTPLLILKVINSYFLQFNLIRGQIIYYLTVITISVICSLAFIPIIYSYELAVNEILLGLLIVELGKLSMFLPKAIKLISIKGRYILSKTELNYVIPLSAIALLSTLTIYVDKFMISSMLDPEKYAEYQVGAFSIPFIGVITGSIVTALVPMLARLQAENKNSEIVAQLRSATKKTTLLLLPILIYCIFLGKNLITFFYSEVYSSSGIIFQAYTGIYLLTVIAFSAVMNAVGLHKYIVVNTIINLATNVIFNFLFIPRFGAIGAVCATLLSTYLGYIFPIYLLKKHINASFTSYFPVRFYFKIFSLSAIFSAIIILVMEILNLSDWTALLFSLPFYLLVLLLGSKNENFGLVFKDIIKSIKTKIK